MDGKIINNKILGLKSKLNKGSSESTDCEKQSLRTQPHDINPKPVKMNDSRFSFITSEMQPPVFEPITPKKVSERWFPKGRSFGLYESGGRVAPNVTSILGWSCLLYTSPSPRDVEESRMPSSA